MNTDWFTRFKPAKILELVSSNMGDYSAILQKQLERLLRLEL
jgi:hypothetical protein